LKESVPAVCLIAGLLNDYSNIIKVVQTCFRPVKASERMIESGELNAGNTTLIRCLYLLGLFAQHGKIDTRGEQFTAALGLPRNVSVTGLIAKSLSAFSKPIVPEPLRKIAITSYGNSFERNAESRLPLSW
jgi:ABC-type polar amino acid transport system ATPase subunit